MTEDVTGLQNPIFKFIQNNSRPSSNMQYHPMNQMGGMNSLENQMINQNLMMSGQMNQMQNPMGSSGMNNGMMNNQMNQNSMMGSQMGQMNNQMAQNMMGNQMGQMNNQMAQNMMGNQMGQMARTSTNTSINKKIPVIHKEIQPVIQENIQPVITKEIQPIIERYIQPVIFQETQNIEVVIQQLQQLKQSHGDSGKISLDEPNYKKENIIDSYIQPYIQREVQIIPKTKVEPRVERQVQKIKEYIYVPYIQCRDGSILPYVKKDTNNNNNSQIMETIIAVNFRSINEDIIYPIACKKTDIFSNIEKKLYKEYPILKKKKIYFIANGKVVNKSYTFEQNNIKSGDTILINEM